MDMVSRESLLAFCLMPVNDVHSFLHEMSRNVHEQVKTLVDILRSVSKRTRDVVDASDSLKLHTRLDADRKPGRPLPIYVNSLTLRVYYDRGRAKYFTIPKTIKTLIVAGTIAEDDYISIPSTVTHLQWSVINFQGELQLSEGLKHLNCELCTVRFILNKLRRRSNRLTYTIANSTYTRNCATSLSGGIVCPPGANTHTVLRGSAKRVAEEDRIPR